MFRNARRLPAWVLGWRQFLRRWMSRSPIPPPKRDPYRPEFDRLEFREQIGDTFLQAAIPAAGIGAMLFAAALMRRSEAQEVAVSAPTSPAPQRLPDFQFQPPLAPIPEELRFSFSVAPTLDQVAAIEPSPFDQTEEPPPAPEGVSGAVATNESPHDGGGGGGGDVAAGIGIQPAGTLASMSGGGGGLPEAAQFSPPAPQGSGTTNPNSGQSTTSTTPTGIPPTPISGPPTGTDSTATAKIGNGNSSSDSAAAQQAFAKAPVAFEANVGQTDPQVKYLVHSPHLNLYLTANEAVYMLPHPALSGSGTPAAPSGVTMPSASEFDVVRMHLVGANANISPVGRLELAAKSNYYIGNDPNQWHSGIANFGEVAYQGVYNGVDLVYHGSDDRKIG